MYICHYNVAPGPLSKMHKAWQKGDLDTVREINDRLLPLHDALFCETSPGPVKYAAHLLAFVHLTLVYPFVKLQKTVKQR